ncbi:Conserved_hypothetical protein [Hexamita inflata]|uniref:Transmembrane protein n=1 Tax=Hexamita inflata TaxID=28002 RepID=A0ABP1HX89_9EUKA
MLLVYYVNNLLCFNTNNTVILNYQTKELLFKAWPRTDDTRETQVCKQLSGDQYTFSVHTNTYTYTYPDLLLYDATQYIQIVIPCIDALGNCALAFKATSAIYTMQYQSAKQNITEVVSNLRRLDFNRSACGTNQYLLYGRNISLAPKYPGVVSNIFQTVSTPSNCKYPLDPISVVAANNQVDKKAFVKFFAYPNYVLQANTFRVTPAIFVSQTYPCSLIQYSIPQQGLSSWCNNMVTNLANSSLGYFNVEYNVPGKIPNRDGTLTRDANYTVVYTSNKLQDIVQQHLDCYSSQQLTIFSTSILLQNTLNASMINCKAPIRSFVAYDYDRVVTRVMFQQHEVFTFGEVFTIDFITSSQVLNSSFEWLSCDISTDKQNCLLLLSQKDKVLDYVLNTQQLFYKSNSIIQMFLLQPTLTVSQFSSSQLIIKQTEACVKLSCQQVNAESKYLVLSLGNKNKYSGDVLNLSQQMTFPNTKGEYCFQKIFSDNEVKMIRSGMIQFDDVKIPIEAVQDLRKSVNVENIQWIVTGTAVVVGLYVGASVWMGLV